jgi:hypothetical protein
MAQATVTVTYDDVLTGGNDESQHSTWAYGTISVSAGPATYATGGLGFLTSGGGIVWVVGDFPKVLTPTPRDVYFYSAALAGGTVGGYGYFWNKAANKFLIQAAFTVTSGTGPQGVEMTNGTAIPANVSNDVIRFEARFLKAMSGF